MADALNTDKGMVERTAEQWSRGFRVTLIIGLILLVAAGLVAGLVFSVNPIAIAIGAVVGLAVLALVLWYIFGGTDRFVAKCMVNGDFQYHKNGEKLWEHLNRNIPSPGGDKTLDSQYLLSVEAVMWRISSLCAGGGEHFKGLHEKDFLAAAAYRIKGGGSSSLYYIACELSKLDPNLQGDELFQALCDILGLATAGLNENEFNDINDIKVKANWREYEPPRHEDKQQKYLDEDEKAEETDEAAPALVQEISLEECYQTLGLSRDNTNLREVKKTYRKLAMEHHPDKGGDAKKFRACNEAYEQLVKNLPQDQRHQVHHQSWNQQAPPYQQQHQQAPSPYQHQQQHQQDEGLVQQGP